MGAPCPTLSPLGGIGITIAEREREAGGGRSDLLARFCKGPEVSRQCFGALYDDGVDADASRSSQILCERSRER